MCIYGSCALSVQRRGAGGGALVYHAGIQEQEDYGVSVGRKGLLMREILVQLTNQWLNFTGCYLQPPLLHTGLQHSNASPTHSFEAAHTLQGRVTPI